MPAGQTRGFAAAQAPGHLHAADPSAVDIYHMLWACIHDDMLFGTFEVEPVDSVLDQRRFGG
ncbi:MAG: hypothetical protein AB7J35_12525 [Dehalococcoidia bacterium]